MNKAIAEVYGWIVGLMHILAVAFIALFPIEQYVGFSYTPSIWIGKAILFLIYVAVFGSISVLISINEHLRDISAKLGVGGSGEVNSSSSRRRIEPE